MLNYTAVTGHVTQYKPIFYSLVWCVHVTDRVTAYIAPGDFIKKQ